MYGTTLRQLRLDIISLDEIWLLADNEELLMSYQDFPWFKEQAVKAILNVDELSSRYYY